MGLNAVLVGVRASFQLIVLYLCARLLGPEGYGTVSFGMATVAVLQIFLDGGLSSVVATTPGLKHSVRRALHWWGVLVAMAVALILIGANWIGVGFLGSGMSGWSLGYIAAFLIVSSLAAHRKSSAEAAGKVVNVSLIETVCVVGGSSTSLGLIYVTRNPDLYFLGLLVGGLLQFVLTAMFLRDGWSFWGHVNMTDSKPYVKSGISLVVASLVGNGSAQADIFIGKIFLTSSELGTYALIRDLVNRVNALVTPVLSRVYMPRMVRLVSDGAPDSKVNLLYRGLISAYALSFGMISLFVAGTSSGLANLVFGDRWNFHQGLLFSLGVWGWCRGRALLIGPAMYSKGRYELALQWNLLRLVPSVAAVFFGVRWGAIGLACAVMCASLLEVFFQYIFVERRLGLNGLIELSLIPLSYSSAGAMLAALMFYIANPADVIVAAWVWVGSCAALFLAALRLGSKYFKFSG
ncbi:oligosaccharide flippase family protein [Pseudaquabacterium rugosum]|uniref:Oligosaccharide flippase family protein n=1 Tax=Pseudaquabacterium rugosum TaxID=2984194 RepID=A0ABU9B8V2_9BURK